MTEAALLAAVGAHPSDDTPRLVYADWLEENGRAEQAEFIRVQCRLEAGGPTDPDYADLLAREEELKLWLGTHLPGPTPKLRGGLSLDGGHDWWTESRRGFPRQVHLIGSDLPPATFARRAAAALEKVFARLPTRWLTVGEVSPAQLADLLRQPVAAHLERLSVWASPANEDAADELARRIAAAPVARTIRGLFLGFPVGEPGVEAFARADFPRLETVSAEPDRLTAGEVRTLGRAAWFRHLRELALERDLSDEGFTALAGLDTFPRLHTLTLSGNGFAVSAWEAFARSRSFPALARLNLNSVDMSRSRMAALAGAKGFALHHLDLWQGAIGNDGAAALARAGWAESLRRLDLSNNRITVAGAKALAASARLGNLRHLNVSQNAIGKGLRAIVGSPHLRRLTALSIIVPGIADRDPAAVLGSLHTRELRHLDAAGLHLGPAGARLLASDPRFANLTRLRLGFCQLGDDGTAALLTSPQLQNLVELDLSNNGITGGVKALTNPAVLPGLGVCRLFLNPLAPELVKKLRRRPGVQI
jgi:uncharacterized protein (TIGR02996 family)